MVSEHLGEDQSKDLDHAIEINDLRSKSQRFRGNLLFEKRQVPYTPISHPFVERLIGSIRRELLDQVFFWNTVDLERKLRSFQLYFNHSRTHASLDGDTPAERSGSVVTHPAALRNFSWEKHCGGLFELPVAA